MFFYAYTKSKLNLYDIFNVEVRPMKKIRMSLALGLFTTISLAYSIIIKKGLDLELYIVMRYIFVGFLVTLYSALLNYFNLRFAHTTFMILLITANLYVILFMPSLSEGFSDLGIILIWMILNISGILLGLLIQMIKYIKDKYEQ